MTVDADLAVGDNPHLSIIPSVSIVVVTFGTGPVVLEMLDAVALHTTINHEVIVVDCLPPDPTSRTSALLSGRTDIRLLVVDDNLGFAGGNEYGVEHARGEYLCFLNADVIVGPGWLEPLLAALDDPTVGIAAPVFLNDDGSLQEAGQLIFADTFTASIGGDVMPGDRTNVFSRDVDYASAACWLVRRMDHLEIGGFDRHYHPAYFEDADYALRMEMRGKVTRLVADVPLVHRRGQGTGKRDAALGQNTHARFKRQWATHLADRPTRPTVAAEAFSARDRLCGTATLFVAWSDRSTETERTAAFERSLALAAASPRDRVTFLTDVAASAPAQALARRNGLEVVVVNESETDRADVEADRISLADDVVGVEGDQPTDLIQRVVTFTLVGGALVCTAAVLMHWLLSDS